MRGKHLDNKEPDHVVFADLIFEDRPSLQGVSCDVWLPEFGRNDPELVLHPSAEHYEIFQSLANRSVHWMKFSSKTVADSEGNHRIIEADRVFIRHHTHKWSGEIHDQKVYCDPVDLRIIEEMGRGETQPTHLTFWITENDLLHPALLQGTSYEGTIEIERGYTHAFHLHDGTPIHFDSHYTWSDPDRRTRVRKEYLVARATTSKPAINWQYVIEALLPALDELLSVTTIATRNVTHCVGWDAIDQTHHVHFYRSDHSIPDKPKRWGVNRDGIVSRDKADELIAHCYAQLRESPYRLAILSTILSLVPPKPPIVEEQYLSLFACIEELLAVFKKDRNVTKILSTTHFKKVRDALSAAIDGLQGDWITEDQRNRLKQKLGELNHAPLRAIFVDFCKTFNLDAGHLWPVFAEDGLLDLAKIRNRLIHGNPFPRELNDCVQAAWIHLQWTMQRILCAILGWPMDAVESQPTYLESMQANAYTQLADYRRRLTAGESDPPPTDSAAPK